MKTYSRRVNSNSDGPSNKRKHVEELAEVELPPSKPKIARRSIQDYFKPKQIASPSPSSSAVLKGSSSDPVEPNSTPPSSPPAKFADAAQRLKERPKRRLSTRPNFQRLTHASTPSSDAETDDHGSTSTQETVSRQPLKPVAANLQQVQLDLGVSAMKQCKACGMEYNSTNTEDRKLHDNYHKRKLKGTQPMRAPYGLVLKTTQIDGESHEIRMLDCRGPVQSRVHFEQALETMYADLSGDEISSEDLWSEIPNPIKSSILSKAPRFTIFMLLVDRTPAAILVAERITQGGGYLDDFRSSQPEANGTGGNNSKAYGKPDIVKPAMMSVERIWVDRERRRKGLASTLINHARKVLIPGLEIRRSQVAFSWPTSMGRALATWFSLGQHDEAIPFLVNLADCPDV